MTDNNTHRDADDIANALNNAHVLGDDVWQDVILRHPQYDDQATGTVDDGDGKKAVIGRNLFTFHEGVQLFRHGMPRHDVSGEWDHEPWDSDPE